MCFKIKVIQSPNFYVFNTLVATNSAIKCTVYPFLQEAAQVKVPLLPEEVQVTRSVTHLRHTLQRQREGEHVPRGFHHRAARRCAYQRTSTPHAVQGYQRGKLRQRQH